MRDEVDELTEAWARERPDLELGPVTVFSRISRLARHLDLARREAFTAHGIESWEFDVLAALRRAGAPYELSPGRLLRETLVTSGTMTNRVDRLAARGLVERHPDPEDRRGVIVQLTAEGKTAGGRTLVVPTDRTVGHFVPGMPMVFATPMMILEMEMASSAAIRGKLQPGWVTVGTEVNVRHLAAALVGATVRTTAKVIAVERRVIRFEVAVDVSEVIMADCKLHEIPKRGQELCCFLETLECLLIAA